MTADEARKKTPALETLAAQETVTKQEAAALLGVTSTRSVERYVSEGKLHPVEQTAGGRGKTVSFKTADVLALKTEMERRAETNALQRQEGREALTTTKGDRGSAVAVVASLLEQHMAMTERLGAKLDEALSRHDPRPLWLTREQALEISGLPASVLQQGIRDGRLSPLGRGRAWRLSRDELLLFSGSLRRK